AGSFELDGIRLDVKDQAGDLEVEITAHDTLRGAAIDSAQLTVSETDELTDPRVAGRYMALSLVSDAVDGYFRLGRPTAFIKDGGARR
ncbi:MAG: hypothetical protein V7608_2585, partial [Hyphomicrobiales bacterium]